MRLQVPWGALSAAVDSGHLLLVIRGLGLRKNLRFELKSIVSAVLQVFLLRSSQCADSARSRLRIGLNTTLAIVVAQESSRPSIIG